MFTKKFEHNCCCIKYFIFFLLFLTTIVASIQTTTIQAGVHSLPDHYSSLPFSSTITRGFSYTMLMLAITNFVTQSVPTYPNNTLMSCLPNEKGRILLGQKNFTTCLQHNASGHYSLVSPINFSNFFR